MTVIPDGWRVVPLGDPAVGRLVGGGTPSTAVPEFWNGDIPWVTPTDVTSCSGRRLMNTERCISDAGMAAAATHMVPAGSLLLCTRATVGEVRIAGRPVCTNQGFKSVVPSAEINSTFLYYQLHLSKPEMVRRSSGSTFLELSKAEAGAIEILLPPREEQDRIAGALGDLDDLIDALKVLLEKKRDVAEAMRDDITAGRRRLGTFSAKWTETTLEEMGSAYSGLSGKSSSDFQGGNARYVEFTNVIQNTRIRTSSLPAVKVSAGERQNAIRTGDVLVNGSSETPDEVALASSVGDDAPSECFLNSFCFGFRPFDDAPLDSEYLAYFLRGSEGRRMVGPLAQGSTRYNISKGSLLGAKFFLPEQDEQEAIAEALRGMDEELASLKATQDKYVSIRDGMMDELLTGRTRLT